MLCTTELPIYQHPATCFCRSKDILPEGNTDVKSNLNDKPETNTTQPNSDEGTCKEDSSYEKEGTCKDDSSYEKDRSTPDPEKDDMLVRRISVSQRPPGVTLTHFLPVPFSLQKAEEKPQISQPKEKPIRSESVKIM